MRPTIVQRRKHNPLFRFEIIGGRDTRARNTSAAQRSSNLTLSSASKGSVDN
jgi:hypothetical protein